MLTPDEARKRGFIIDDTCYPWVAYKGDRFAPTEIHGILTEKEAELLEKIEKLGKECAELRERLSDYRDPQED